ncbi:MAG: L,D-transpeptidase family protein [Richelia sp. RM2_1_2]|nr:L,D-transpeptidase family protein [Richelia sp. RM2_1_2]
MKKTAIAISLMFFASTASAGVGSIEEQTLLLSALSTATPTQQRAILHTTKQLPLPPIPPLEQPANIITNLLVGPYGMTDWVEAPKQEITITQPRQAYIIVNIPAFTLYAVEDDRVVFTSRVIVGKGSTEHDKTPLMTTTITSVAWNPYWAPPYRYNRHDTRTNWLRDPTYLAKNRLSIIKNADHSILRNDEITEATFLSDAHTIVQTPGEDNTLGRALFYLDNPYSVYMHDTNKPALFSQKTRNFSMGCIRVQEWQRLAAWALNKPQESVINEVQTGKMLFNWLKQPMPVHVVYWPVDIVDGNVVYYEDIYKWMK